MKTVKKIKLIINKSERETFDFWIRRCKLLYNVALDEQKYYYQATKKHLSVYDQKKELVELKQWDSSWKDIPNKALSNTLFQLDDAYKRFFKGSGFPKYKNDDTFNSIEFVEKDVKIKNNLVYLPKLKKGIKGTEIFPLKYSTVRLKRENNSYYLCFICEIEPITKNNTNKNIVGCDLGLKTLMTDSNGYEIKRFNIKLIKKYQQRIDKLNISLSTKKRGSSRRKKVKKQLNKAHQRLKNTRLDYLHKITTKYIKEIKEDIVVIGKLNVADLMISDGTKKQKNISRSYGTSSINIFLDMLKYKATKYNKELHMVDEEYTSKTCSCCGTVKHDLEINDRVFICPNCGIEIPRDRNGALNMIKVYLKTFNPIGINIEKVRDKHRLSKIARFEQPEMVCSI